MKLLEDVVESTVEGIATYVVAPMKMDYLYKGSARNLKERLKDHQAGRVSRTKNRRPLVLVFVKEFDNYTDARKYENFLKPGQGRKFLKEYVEKRF